MGKDAALAPLEKATSLLAECRTVSDAVDLRDKARAAEVYAKQAKLGLEAQNHAAEIKLRAERKAGELLATMDRVNHRPEKGSVVKPFSAELDEMGISKTQSHRWQQIASLPEEDFGELVADANESGKELTSTLVYRAAQSSRKPVNGVAPKEKTGTISALLMQLDEAVRRELAKWVPGGGAVFTDRLRSLADQIADTGGLAE